VQTGIGLTHTRRMIKVKSSWACKVVIFGTMKVKMFDGIICAFDNVHHVSALKKNLISLGTLDASGLTYSSSGGKIKICKRSLVIMRVEKLSNNLYKLMGDNTSRGATISTSEISEDNSAHLWHHRLSHISEQAMDELHKQSY